MSETRNWRRGITLNTSRTKFWTPKDRHDNDRLEQTMIFSNFHDSDEGRSRQLVCTLNPQHPEYETNAQLIAAAPKLLDAYGIFVNEVFDEETMRVLEAHYGENYSIWLCGLINNTKAGLAEAVKEG